LPIFLANASGYDAQPSDRGRGAEAASYFTSSMLIQRFSLADSIAASSTRWVW
jgi:hypothetical protein